MGLYYYMPWTPQERQGRRGRREDDTFKMFGCNPHPRILTLVSKPGRQHTEISLKQHTMKNTQGIHVMTSSQKLLKNACHDHLSKHCCLFLVRTGFGTQVINLAIHVVQAVCTHQYSQRQTTILLRIAKIFFPAGNISQSKHTTILLRKPHRRLLCV